jgi:twitching motility two-component system response regulator PilH
MKKILIASESNAFLQRNSTLLMRKQFKLFTAMSGAESLKLHEEHHFDLILADMRLEDMSGCTLCTHIRRGKYSSQVPVVLICQNMPESIQSLEQSGASKLLIKPIDPAKLLWSIGCFIDVELGRSKRVKFHDRVSCKEQNQEYSSYSHDISNTGIQLESEIRLVIGSRITMQFTLPGSCRIEAAGKIVRYINGLEGKNRYGVKFIDLLGSCHSAINLYVASMSISESSFSL